MRVSLLVIAMLLSGQARAETVWAAKPFLRYAKTTLTLAPARETVSTEDLTDTSAEVVSMQPRAVPAIGLAVSYGKYLNISYAATREQWQRQSDQGKTKSKIFEVHSARGPLQFDLVVARATGLYQENLPRTDLRPFQDRLFRDSDATTVLPDMKMNTVGVGIAWTIDHEAFDAGAAFHQVRPIQASGWSPVIGSFVNNLVLRNDASFIPLELQTYFADYGEIRSLSMNVFGLQGGLGGVYLENHWFAAAQVMVGGAVSSVAASPAKASLAVRGTNALDMRGSAGYAMENYVAGLTGYKQVLSSRLGDGGLSSSTSSLELFWRRKIHL